MSKEIININLPQIYKTEANKSAFKTLGVYVYKPIDDAVKYTPRVIEVYHSNTYKPTVEQFALQSLFYKKTEYIGEESLATEKCLILISETESVEENRLGAEKYSMRLEVINVLHNIKTAVSTMSTLLDEINGVTLELLRNGAIEAIRSVEGTDKISNYIPAVIGAFEWCKLGERLNTNSALIGKVTILGGIIGAITKGIISARDVSLYGGLNAEAAVSSAQQNIVNLNCLYKEAYQRGIQLPKIDNSKCMEDGSWWTKSMSMFAAQDKIKQQAEEIKRQAEIKISEERWKLKQEYHAKLAELEKGKEKYIESHIPKATGIVIKSLSGGDWTIYTQLHEGDSSKWGYVTPHSGSYSYNQITPKYWFYNQLPKTANYSDWPPSPYSAGHTTHVQDITSYYTKMLNRFRASYPYF